MVSSTNNDSFGCNRRDFMKIAGLGAATMAIPGLISNANAASVSNVNQEIIETDVLVIGSGIAGSFAAIGAKKKGVDVILVEKGGACYSGQSPFCTNFSFIDKGYDSKDQWIEKTSRAEEYITNKTYSKIFADESYARYQDAVSWGLMDDNEKGRPPKFRKKLKENGVKIIERTMITELIRKNDRVIGAVGLQIDKGAFVIIKASAVVLCTGGGAFKTPGWPVGSLTSDGDAAAYRIGAEISGKEFTDYHFTHFENPADFHGNWAGIFGEAGIETAFRPMDLGLGQDGPGGWGPPEYLPEMAHAGKVPIMPSDMPRPPEPPGGRPPGPPPGGKGKGEPGIRDNSLSIAGCSTAGMAPHKSEGIFPGNDKCESSVSGLFAAGDALCTNGARYGVGGSGSSSGAVTGNRAGTYAAEFAQKNSKLNPTKKELNEIKSNMFAPMQREKGYSPTWITNVLQGIMVPYYVLYVKKQDRLEAALTNIKFLRDHFAPNLIASDPHQLRHVHETQNMILNAEMKLRAAMMRKESRGSHYREDFPFRDDANWLAWIKITRDRDRMKLTKVPIPEDWRPDPSLPYEKRYPHRLPGELEFLKRNSA